MLRLAGRSSESSELIPVSTSNVILKGHGNARLPEMLEANDSDFGGGAWLSEEHPISL